MIETCSSNKQWNKSELSWSYTFLFFFKLLLDRKRTLYSVTSLRCSLEPLSDQSTAQADWWGLCLTNKVLWSIKCFECFNEDRVFDVNLFPPTLLSLAPTPPPHTHTYSSACTRSLTVTLQPCIADVRVDRLHREASAPMQRHEPKQCFWGEASAERKTEVDKWIPLHSPADLGEGKLYTCSCTIEFHWTPVVVFILTGQSHRLFEFILTTSWWSWSS